MTRIANEFPQLTWFKVGFLTEEFFTCINFLGIENDPVLIEPYKTGLKMLRRGPAGKPRIPRVEYEGPDANHVLKIVAKCAMSPTT